MEELYTWLKIGALAASIAGSIFVVVISIINKVKKAKANGEKVDIGAVVSESVSALSDIVENYLPTYIEEAEGLTNVPGAVKKMMVLSKVALKCSEIGLDYQSNSAAISEQVDKLVELTNKVNVNKSTSSNSNVIEVK